MSSLRMLVACGVLLGGCMARFQSGPARSNPVPRVRVEAGACTAPASLFDCRDLISVRTYLGDYFRANGIVPSDDPGIPRAVVGVTGAGSMVRVEVTMHARSGGAVWSAKTQGDTVLRALIRLEPLLEDHLEFRERILTSKDLRAAMDKLGRKEISATANGFVYK